MAAMVMCERARRMEEYFINVHDFQTGILQRPPIAEVRERFRRLRESEFAEAGDNRRDLVELQGCIERGLKAELDGDYRKACPCYKEAYDLILDRAWVVPSATVDWHWDVLWLLVWTFSAVLPLLQIKFRAYQYCMDMLVNMEKYLYYGHPDMVALYQNPTVYFENSRVQHFPLIDWLYSTVRTVALEMGNARFAVSGITTLPGAVPIMGFLNTRLSRQHYIYGNFKVGMQLEVKKWGHMDTNWSVIVDDAVSRVRRGLPLDEQMEEEISTALMVLQRTPNVRSQTKSLIRRLLRLRDNKSFGDVVQDLYQDVIESHSEEKEFCNEEEIYGDLVEGILNNGGRPKHVKPGLGYKLLDDFYCASMTHLVRFEKEGRKEDLDKAIKLCYQGLRKVVVPQSLEYLQAIHHLLGVCLFQREVFFDVKEGKAQEFDGATKVEELDGGQSSGGEKNSHDFMHHLRTAAQISTDVLKSCAPLGDRSITMSERSCYTWWYLEVAAHFKPSTPGETSREPLPPTSHSRMTTMPAGQLHEGFRMSERGRSQALTSQLVDPETLELSAEAEAEQMLLSRRLMGGGTVFVEYSFVCQEGDGCSLINFFNIYVLDSDGVNHTFSNNNKEEVQEMMEAIKKCVEILEVSMSKEDETYLDENLNHLYRLLVEPMEEFLKKMAPTDSLVISPHGILNRVPFHILMPDKDHYLLDRHTISYTPSFRVLEICGQRGSTLNAKAFQSPGGAAIGNPVYEEGRELLGSGKEIQSISKLFQHDQVKVFQGDLATKEELLKQATIRQGFLHVAVHGRADKDNGSFPRSTTSAWRGALEFGQNESEESAPELLKSEEIIQKWAGTWQPLFVVLSACQSASGEQLGGEGVLNLLRAILVAGSPCCIGSMWEVDDEASPVLMDELYNGMREGMTAGSALRAAILHTRAQKDKLNDLYKVWHWAAFVMWGLPSVCLPKEMQHIREL